MDSEKIDFLGKKALAVRKHVVQMVARHGRGYVQQGLGAADLFTVLFFVLLNIRYNILSAERKIAIMVHQSHDERV